MNISRSQILAGAAVTLAISGAGAAFAQIQSNLPVVDAEPQDIGECRAPTSHAGTDHVLTCSCPARPANQGHSGSVWGTDVYTADSAICTTARHAGVIDDAGGQVILQMLPGQTSYAGSRRNGVTTKKYGSYAASYRYVRTSYGFAGSGFSAVVDLPDFDMSMIATEKKKKNSGLGSILGAVSRTTGDRTVREVTNAGAQLADAAPSGGGAGALDIGECKGLPGRYRDEPGTLLSCTCPASPSEQSPVWGTGVYSGDSYICKAGIHAGAITRAGGRLAIQTLADQPSYAGSTHNGIATMSYGKTNKLGAYRFVR